MKTLDYKANYRQIVEKLGMSQKRTIAILIAFWVLLMISYIVFSSSSNIHFKLGFLPALLLAYPVTFLLHYHFYTVNAIVSELEEVKLELQALKNKSQGQN
ncbi:MAG: hypothetical protein KC422_11655 [Trueperaceae bacterium]|nr:hypothetical protein [Trueperaceae bacterium]